jgi:uncharacterized iron-regulated membrane protein
MSISGPLQPQTALYRAVWRWHFLAGLFALPFLLNLAITGGLYLFAPEINHILYRSLEDVPARADTPMPASVLVEKAAGATQGDVSSLTLPLEPDRSVEMLIRTGAVESQTAYVDPYDGRLLGTIPAGGSCRSCEKSTACNISAFGRVALSRSRRAGPLFWRFRAFFSGGRAAKRAAS